MSFLQKTPNLSVNGKYLLSPQQESSIVVYFYGGILGKFQDTLVIQAVNGKRFLFPINVEVVKETGVADSLQSSEAPFSFDIAPNPAGLQASLTLDLREPSNLGCDIIDISGRVAIHVFENEYYPKGISNYDIDMTSLSTGTYFVRIERNGKYYSRKFNYTR
jgi:hypothetical protein